MCEQVASVGLCSLLMSCVRVLLSFVRPLSQHLRLMCVKCAPCYCRRARTLVQNALRNLTAAASLSLTTYAKPFAQDGDLFSNCTERRCHGCKGCALLGRAADWCPQKASSLKVERRWRSRPKPHIVCRSGSDGLRREVDERKSQESVLQRGTGIRSLPGRRSKNGLRPSKKIVTQGQGNLSGSRAAAIRIELPGLTGSTTVQCRL